MKGLLAFWLGPSRGSATSLFRISFAVAALWTAIGVLLNVERLYGANGLVPWSAVSNLPYQRFSLFRLAPTDDRLAWLLACCLLLSSLSLLLGWGSRLAALSIFVVSLSLQHRNPFVCNAGDRLFLILALFCAFLPLDRRWSLAARSAGQKQYAPPASRAWFQRLVALQVAYVYLNAGVGKLGFESWRSGAALGEILASPELCITPFSIGMLGPALTWGTLLFELAFPLLIWVRRYRPYLLAGGVLFHLGIQLTMAVPGFGLVMLASYPCFLEDDEAERLVRFLKSFPNSTKLNMMHPS